MPRLWPGRGDSTPKSSSSKSTFHKRHSSPSRHSRPSRPSRPSSVPSASTSREHSPGAYDHPPDDDITPRAKTPDARRAHSSTSQVSTAPTIATTTATATTTTTTTGINPTTTCSVPQTEKRPRRIELIIKLGGSALTVKTIPHTLHPTRFASSIEAVTRLHRRGIGFILTHGAGSFGHFEAHTHHVAEGDASPLGVSATHAAASALNAHVVHALVARGVPAVGVAPLLVPAKVRNDFVAALLDRGHLPVLHGDACYAGDGRTAIISADALVCSMACAFHFVNRVVFLSDVPGLLRRPPRRQEEENGSDTGGGTASVSGGGGDVTTPLSPLSDGGGVAAGTAAAAALPVVADGDLVRCVVVDETGQFDFEREVETDVNAHDVTGGIAGKVVAAGRCVAETGGRVTAFIAGVGTDAAEQCLTTRPDRRGTVDCTRVCYQLAGAAGVQRVDGDGRLSHGSNVRLRTRTRTVSADGAAAAVGLVKAALPRRGSGLGERARRRAWFV